MPDSLTTKRVALLATDGFEQSELASPLAALRAEGASVLIVSLKAGQIRGMNHLEPGDSFDVSATLDDVTPDEFDALMLPGGLANPDTLRSSAQAVEFVRHFVLAAKPIAAICHAPWILIEAGAVDGLQLTSWPAIQTDLLNAGAEWVDEEVVYNRGIVTSRSPTDLPAFNRKMIEVFAAAPPGGHSAALSADEPTSEEVAFGGSVHVHSTGGIQSVT